MRRIAAWGLAACISLPAIAGGAAAATELDAARIVEKNLAAKGGEQAWQNVKSMVWVGHIERTQTAAPNLPFVLQMKYPGKMRFEVKTQSQVSVRVYDGAQGWKWQTASNGKPELHPYTAEELSFAQEGQFFGSPLLDFNSKGIEVALDGIDEVEGHKAYRLKLAWPSGASRRLWIDAQTFLDLKYDREFHNAIGRSGTISVFYRNYKTIDGLQMPLMIESGSDTAKATDKLVLDRVVVNPPLEDTLFAKPNMPERGNATAIKKTPQERGSSRRLRSWPVSGAGER